jgi:hypothetical protein
MPVEIIPYTDDFERKWEYFVNHSDNGTIFQMRKFLGYHDPGKFNDASLIFSRKNDIYAVLPAVILDYNNEKVLFSHPGSSYGGFVVGGKIGLEPTFEMVELLLSYAKEKKCSRIIVTQTPSYYFKKYSSYLDFALQKNGFTHRKRELSAVLSLDQSSETIYKQFPDGLKRAIKKAVKSGVKVGLSKDVEAYFSILKCNLEMRHNEKPTHAVDELKMLFSLFPGRVKLYSAEKKGEILGGIVTFTCNERVILAFYIAHNHEYQQYRPVDIIIWKLIQESVEQGFTYLDFGTFTLDMEPNWGLCRFKEKFGARGVFRDTFERRI